MSCHTNVICVKSSTIDCKMEITELRMCLIYCFEHHFWTLKVACLELSIEFSTFAYALIMAICQVCIHSMLLQKEVKSNPKQPSCKKCVAPKKAIVKKDVKSKVVAKKWLDGRLLGKFLIMKIQVNSVLNPSETWRRQHKFT